jgi:hypothetical protein
MSFHCVPNQVLYQAEPLPDDSSPRERGGNSRYARAAKITTMAIIAFGCQLDCKGAAGR